MGPTFESLLVKNGLVLFLDAGNIKSYPNSGTVWRDPRAVNLSGTISGLTYTNLNNGTFLFGNPSNVASNAGITLNNTLTISVWLTHRTLPTSTQRYITIGNEVAVLRHDGNGQAHFYIKTNNTLRDLRVNSAIANNIFYNFVATWDGTTQQLYRNLVSIGTSTPPAGTLNGGSNLSWSLSGGEPFVGEMYSVAVYNRVLTANERYTNYFAFLNNRVKTARPANIPLLGRGVTSAFPTLSNARMTSLTSTQGVPNVDYAF